MSELEELGGEAWFRLGDRDLATHLYRSQRLSEGATKTDVAKELAERLGVAVRLLPVTNDTVTTEFDTTLGRLSFQEYFVRHHHDVTVRAIEFVGADSAHATPEVLDALREASRLVIAPSNPLISIDPILQIPGVREIVAERREDVVAVSPLIRGEALKGPAARLLGELGYDISTVGVVDFYEVSSVLGSSTRPTPLWPRRSANAACTSRSRRPSWPRPTTPSASPRRCSRE